MRFIKWLFSGEVLLAGFLTGYLLTPVTGGLIVFSHVFMVLSITSFLYRIYKRKSILLSRRKIVATVIYLALLGFMIVSLAYTPNVNFGQEKVILFASLTAWTFFGTLFLVEDKKGLKRFLQGVILFSVLTSIFMLVTIMGGATGRVGIGGADNVIGVARISALGIIVVIGLFFYQKVNGTKKIFSFILLLLLISSLLSTATRGPLIAVIVSLMIFIPLSFRFSLKNLTITYNKGIASISLLFAAVAAVLPILINRGYFDTVIDRINILVNDNLGGTSVLSRFDRFDTAFKMFTDSPVLGKGIGSFSNFYWGNDSSGYAHNIFLELMSELGFIGVSLFLVLLFYSLTIFVKYIRKNSINAQQIIIFISAFYLIINANISADINGNRLLFAFIALMIMTPKYADSEQTAD